MPPPGLAGDMTEEDQLRLADWPSFVSEISYWVSSGAVYPFFSSAA